MDKQAKHPPYFMIDGYAKLAGYSIKDLAKSMKISEQTLYRKINGQSDFSFSEAARLAKILNRSKDALFLTNDE